MRIIPLLRVMRFRDLVKTLKKRISGEDVRQARESLLNQLEWEYCLRMQELCDIRFYALKNNISIDKVPIEWEYVYTFGSPNPTRVTTKQQWHARQVDDKTASQKQQEILEEIDRWQDRYNQARKKAKS